MTNDRTLPGIPGLDDILDGGIPKGRIVLIMGGPGSGKTVLCSQFLINGIDKYQENGIFITLEEDPIYLHEEMAQFGWNFKEIEESGKLKIIDASPYRLSNNEKDLGKLSIGSREFSIISLIEAIQSYVEKNDAKRLVVDSLCSMILQYPEPMQKRSAMLELIEGLAKTKATCLITQELKSEGIGRDFQDEEYLAHGVILLQTFQVGKIFKRSIQIKKMRRTSVDNQPRQYEITGKGIEVFPKEGIF